MSLNQIQQVSYLEIDTKRVNQSNWALTNGILSPYSVNTGLYPLTNPVLLSNTGMTTASESDLYESAPNGITILKTGVYNILGFVKFQPTASQNNCKIEFNLNGFPLRNHFDYKVDSSLSQTFSINAIGTLSPGLLTIAIGTTLVDNINVTDWGLEIHSLQIS